MLQPGRYYIGDLSAILTPEEVMHTQQFKDGYCSLPDGTTIAKFAVPNGVYRTNHGNNLSVSIGIIGIVPLAAKYNKAEYTRNINLYGMSTFYPQAFEVARGVDLSFGEIIVDISKDGYFEAEREAVINTKEFIQTTGMTEQELLEAQRDGKKFT